MVSIPCNKCKVGTCTGGDSWCIGCAALELAQSHLKIQWQNPGLRRIAEETCLNNARAVRAFSNLDKTLVADAGGRTPVTLTTAQSKRVATRPQRSRTPPRERSLRADRKEPASSASKKADPLPTGDTEEYSYYDEEEEEAASKAKVKEEVKESGAVPEPAHPPRTSGHSDRHEKRAEPSNRQGHRDVKRKGKKTRRGGAKHQRHHREAADPYRPSHRKLRGEDTQLAPTWAAGSQRRY